ncbi:hypothetical protein [Pseudomonas sp. NPDC085632]|uniref:hypothetical protein n=1 Tax=Pseudomonas sp. NPDC085632 TaxID=3364429 RepID=UPI0037CB2936
MLWFCVRSSHGTKSPAWKRSIAINREGIVFVPAVIAGKEKDVSVSTLCDRTPVLLCFDHVYVPVAWVVENFPMCRSHCYDMMMAALFGIQETLCSREAWSRVSHFRGHAGEKKYLGFVS